MSFSLRQYPAASNSILRNLVGLRPTLKEAFSAPAWTVVLVGLAVWQLVAVGLWALLSFVGFETAIFGFPFAIGFVAGAVAALGFVAARAYMSDDPVTIVPHLGGLGIYSLPVALGVALPDVFSDPVTASRLDLAPWVMTVAPIVLFCCAIFGSTNLGARLMDTAHNLRRQAISRSAGFVTGVRENVATGR